ncbi:glycosyl transferase [Cupriavidus sp. USMAHM13]|uniref:glycosyl transferase n=1 Tax=Cupriavidus sp. USMAHM13 TaxID=1389192 RepID=UPI000A768B07|nr:glycosyl transferase [Cupriavidus sp. USMAHM13]
MMKLVYLSPLPWFSFSQRPHKFVEWFRARGGGEVIWVDPYPTRFPKFSDLRKLRGTHSHGRQQDQPPSWLQLLRPKAVPVEPLPLSGALNRPLWKGLLATVAAFAESGNTLLVIGKPSQLALSLLSTGWFVESAYDSMDHFSAFYDGFSRYVMARREQAVVTRAGLLMASSTGLCDQWRSLRPDVALVRNACDPAVLPPPNTLPKARSSAPVFGYIGTIGGWFEWGAVRAAARAQPNATVRLIGPAFVPVPTDLPANVEILPPCSHAEAMKAMASFDVGLIPFKRNQLTDSVDPIKYYEYRALGLPVISTRFGEMRQREGESGVLLADTEQEWGLATQGALATTGTVEEALAFRHEQGWNQRFDTSPIARAIERASRS